MAYIDGYLVPVPTANRDRYREDAARFADLVREFGALQVVEAWGDDVKDGQWTDFRRAVAAKPEESVVFSWVLWPSREARDAATAKLMADPRMAAMKPESFDGKRIVFGGFAPLLTIGTWQD